MPVGAPDVELDVEDERKRPMTYRSRRAEQVTTSCQEVTSYLCH
jgi:hypothetical protein